MLRKLRTPLILASKSPRRQELLSQVGYNFSVKTQDVEEAYSASLSVEEVPVYLAGIKAKAVSDDLKHDSIVIGADTIVNLDGDIFGKPKDEEHAIRLLRRLSGKAHTVITGVCLKTREKEHRFFDVTEVYLKALTDEMIRYYVEEYAPYDKAGGYAIQEWIGMVGIEKINGCYFNVMGMPLSKLWDALDEFIPIDSV